MLERLWLSTSQHCTLTQEGFDVTNKIINVNAPVQKLLMVVVSVGRREERRGGGEFIRLEEFVLNLKFVA
jgi:hypothetical protein